MTEKEKCSEEKAKETSPFTHTPLSRCTDRAIAGYLREGECGEGKVKVKWKRKGYKLFDFLLSLRVITK
ncbi:hypothetical protein HMPREF1977_0958 [Capnocytophaga ochracea F0287]|uniref:Uncharacterized protein n=1 Tax=Capnocytophaga ochracea F0287 TaxID=873517 RepID=E4MRH4_CAPOC|nr:hypothetical protein HMPREF1977_0958 [Capnocytophaga ochracea F0287]